MKTSLWFLPVTLPTLNNNQGPAAAAVLPGGTVEDPVLLLVGVWLDLLRAVGAAFTLLQSLPY